MNPPPWDAGVHLDRHPATVLAWSWCALAVLLSQSAVEHWLFLLSPAAAWAWRLGFLALGLYWVGEWIFGSQAPRGRAVVALGVLATAIALAFDELRSLALAAGVWDGAWSRPDSLPEPVLWLGAAGGGYLWQVGWAVGEPDHDSRAVGERLRLPVRWFLAAAIWIWFLFPAGESDSGIYANVGWAMAGTTLAIGLLVFERYSYRTWGKLWPGALLRLLWWGVFLR
jgi:hypothetical protein